MSMLINVNKINDISGKTILILLNLVAKITCLLDLIYCDLDYRWMEPISLLNSWVIHKKVSKILIFLYWNFGEYFFWSHTKSDTSAKEQWYLLYIVGTNFCIKWNNGKWNTLVEDPELVMKSIKQRNLNV